MLVFYETEDKKKSGIVEIVKAYKDKASEQIVCETNFSRFSIQFQCPKSESDSQKWANTFFQELFSTGKAKIIIGSIY